MKKLLFLFLLIPFLWVSCPSDDSGVTLDKTKLEMTAGDFAELKATVTIDSPNKAITWSTSNSSVATVKGGTVTALAGGTATITVSCNADSSQKAKCTVKVAPLLSKSVAEYFAENEVFIGWNLGNGFDAGTGAYGTWTRKIDEDFLPKVKAAGFKMVRIPITWNQNIGAAPNYTIDATMFNEVKQVVDWAHDAGLVTIINVHHDDNTWFSMNNLLGSGHDEIVVKYTKVWEQIAEKFKNYDDWLIFESFNELHDGNWGWNVKDDKEYGIINDLNQKFTDTIRKAGGKNVKRYLVVQPLCGKPHQAIAATFKLPKDPAEDKLIVSMHYYEPEAFALNGTSTTWSQNFTAQFKEYADKFTKNGIPIIFGECGPTAQGRTGTDKTTADTNRLTYIASMYSEAKKNGIVPVYWDNGTIYATPPQSNPNRYGENFGLWDRRGTGGTLELFDGSQAVIDAMMEAVY